MYTHAVTYIRIALKEKHWHDIEYEKSTVALYIVLSGSIMFYVSLQAFLSLSLLVLTLLCHVQKYFGLYRSCCFTFHSFILFYFRSFGKSESHCRGPYTYKQIKSTVCLWCIHIFWTTFLYNTSRCTKISKECHYILLQTTQSIHHEMKERKSSFTRKRY